VKKFAARTEPGN